jgi:hypothetical protein
MNPIRHDLADADHVGLVGWVDTYWDGPAWRNRRNDCTEPFSSARRDTRQIIAGASVAQWDGIHHAIRNRDGSITEINRCHPQLCNEPTGPVRAGRRRASV